MNGFILSFLVIIKAQCGSLSPGKYKYRKPLAPPQKCSDSLLLESTKDLSNLTGCDTFFIDDQYCGPGE